jgi:peptide chain release factor
MATSPVFAVSPQKQQALLNRMAELAIREEDLEERFVRSSGVGGSI